MRKLLIICLSILTLSSFTFGLSKRERVVNEIMSNHADLLKKKYKLSIEGIGSSIPDYVKGFNMHFRSNQKLNVDQVRKLYIEVSQNLLDSINSNERLRPFMYKYPFDYNNLKYTIAFYEGPGKRVDPRHIAYVSLVDGNIYYKSYDHLKQDFIRRHSETYEEALRIVQAQSQ